MEDLTSARDECSHCGLPQEENWKRCPRCGLTHCCPSCGEAVDLQWSWCPNCAGAIDQPAAFWGIGGDEAAPAADRPRMREFKEEINAGYVLFFERFSQRLPLPYWATWIIFGELVFLIHYLVGQWCGVNVLDDATWMTGAIIGITLALVEAGCRRMRSLVVQMHPIVNLELSDYRSFVLNQLDWIFSNQKFYLAALVMGCINLTISLTYGSWYTDSRMTFSLHAVHFFCGCVCGLALWGGVCVIKIMRDTTATDLRLDVDAEDKCWGTGLLGKKVLAYSLSYFVVGMLIAVYIMVSPWSRRDHEYVQYLVYAWALFPYLIALTTFILPVLHIHRAIIREKQERLDELAERKIHLRSEIENLRAAKDAALLMRRERLLDDYGNIGEDRRRVKQMNLWPYDLRQIGQFVVTLTIPAVLFFWENRETIQDLMSSILRR